MTYSLKLGISGNDFIADENGGIYKWMKSQSSEVGGTPHACFGWKDKNMYAGCFITKEDGIAYLNLVVKKKKFWTKKNLTFIAKVCYDFLECKNIVSLTSRSNNTMQGILDKLGFIRNGIMNVEGEDRLSFELPENVLEKQEWYLHG